MKLKPLGDRVIIKQDEVEAKTSSGLYLAADTKEKPTTGTVLEVRPGKMDKEGNYLPMPVAKGDRVIYSKYGGNEVTCDDEELLIVRAEDIYAIIA